MTHADGHGFPLRLVPHDKSEEPSGLVLSLRQAVDLLARINDRATYSALRLALAEDRAIVFTADEAPLRVEAPLAWLDGDGALLVPSGFRLDAPPRWRAEIAARLLARHGLAGPAALLHSPGGSLHLVDLSTSRALQDIDQERLARLAR